MKRQHPTDPNLLWCFKCSEYKEKCDFNGDSRRKEGKQSECRLHRSEYYLKNKKTAINQALMWAKKNKENARQAHNAYTKTEKGKTKIKSLSKQRVDNLADCYIKQALRQAGIYSNNPETIELKRQQIIAKRTLKEFKQWRKEQENESDYTDVHGKQREDEENYEGRV